MQLGLSTTQVVKGGIKPIQTNVHKTTLNNTIFKIVTKGLYIRPIEAIVREISTNALDGHIAKGNVDQPFDITLPNVITPYFIVRDYGCSMDNKTVFDVYAVLGESTKNSSSTSIGGWGVGGKSPAAYTDTFFITTYLDGVRRVYQSSCLQNTTPLELLLEDSTEELNGVEVKIPVKKEDFDKFISAVKTQIAPFKVKPNIKNSESFSDDFTYSFDLSTAESLDISPTILSPNNSGNLSKQKITTKVYSDCTKDFIAIRMGCVVYPINVTSDFYSENEATMKKIKQISGKDSFLLDLPVDSVDIKPSREDLDYTDRTKDVLNQLLHTLFKYYKKDILSIVFAARNMDSHDACTYIVKNAKNNNVVKYISKNYKTKTFFAEKRILYGEINDYFNRAIKKELKQTANSDLLKSDFSILDYDLKTKKEDISFFIHNFSKDLEITIIKKSYKYLMKFNYAVSENTLPKSGLYYAYALRDYATYDKFKKGIFLGEQENKYLLMSEKEIQFYLPIFEKYYKKVNVVDLEPVPSNSSTSYSSTYSSKNSQISTVCTGIEGKASQVFYESYSFKSINKIKDHFRSSSSIPFYFIGVSTKDYLNKNLLSEFSELLNIGIVAIRVPSSFLHKVINKKELEILNFDDSVNKFLNMLDKNQKEKILNNYLSIFYKKMFIAFLYRNNGSYSKIFSDNVIKHLRNHFFKFISYDFSETKYHSQIASYLVPQKDKEKIKKIAKNDKKRVIKRLDLIFKNKPTFNLITYDSDPELVLQLFKLNFKAFNYEQTTTTERT